MGRKRKEKLQIFKRMNVYFQNLFLNEKYLIRIKDMGKKGRNLFKENI